MVIYRIDLVTGSNGIILVTSFVLFQADREIDHAGLQDVLELCQDFAAVPNDPHIVWDVQDRSGHPIIEKWVQHSSEEEKWITNTCC